MSLTTGWFSLQRSIPRKIQEQWETGISQATEALGLLKEERLAKFSFVYEEGKAEFNPHMLQELQAQQNQGSKQDQNDTELVSLTPPDSTQSSPSSTKPTTDPLCPPTDSSTSAGKSGLPKKAPKTSVKRDRRKPRTTTVWIKTAPASERDIPLTKSTDQVTITVNDDHHFVRLWEL